MHTSVAGLVAQLGFFVVALVLLGCTFFMRRPGARLFASFSTVRETYTSGGVACYWIGYVCLFIGIILQLVNRL